MNSHSVLLVALLTITLLPDPVHARRVHSNDFFDGTHTQLLDGTITRISWADPNVRIYLLVTNTAGRTSEFALRGTNISSMHRAGVHRDSLLPGDVVTVKVSPSRSEEHGGTLLTLTTTSDKYFQLRR